MSSPRRFYIQMTRDNIWPIIKSSFRAVPLSCGTGPRGITVSFEYNTPALFVGVMFFKTLANGKTAMREVKTLRKKMGLGKPKTRETWYSNPSVYEQTVYEFSLIRDAHINTCFSISEPRAPSSHKPIVVPVGK
jgi:hypothetical protein